MARKRASNEKVVIKITDKKLYSKSITIINGQKYKINEDIKTEKRILKYLTSAKKCPKSIVKYIDFFQSNKNYFLVMSYGGDSLFKFIQKAHGYINDGYILISDWHNFVKIIFKQMIECIEYLHLMNVCHFDISLENMLISDIEVEMIENKNGKQYLRFCTESDQIQISLCDFGLSQLFHSKNINQKNNRFISNKFVGKSNYQSPEITNTKQNFDAKANDIFCVGVCLFMAIIGGSPFKTTNKNDKYFKKILNGQLFDLLKQWKKEHYVNHDLIELFESIFQFEDNRSTIEQIKKCKWLRD